MRLVDRYILMQTAKPLAIALSVVLVALILERILRLFDLLAQRGDEFGPVIAMAVNLVPHYLGLALPAAFFISIFLVSARFGEDNELDALRSFGLSIRRFSRPFIWLGVLLACFSVVLYGYVQPYSRYAYRAILHAATSAAWDLSVTPGSFIDAGGGYTIHADRAAADGQWLENVFVHQREDDGDEVTTTARRGFLEPAEDGARLRLTLVDAVQFRTTPDGRGSILAFETVLVDRPLSRRGSLFRARGDSERELTLGELRSEMGNPDSPVAQSRLKAEFDARLVRSASIAFLPMLAVPMGMAAKRTFRWQGIAIASVALLLYHHAIQLGESMADLGRVDSLVGVWGPFAVFATCCVLVHLGAERRPGTGRAGAAFEWLDDGIRRLRGLLRRRRAQT